MESASSPGGQSLAGHLHDLRHHLADAMVSLGEALAHASTEDQKRLTAVARHLSLAQQRLAELQA